MDLNALLDAIEAHMERYTGDGYGGTRPDVQPIRAALARLEAVERDYQETIDTVERDLDAERAAIARVWDVLGVAPENQDDDALSQMVADLKRERDEWKERVKMAQFDDESYYEPQLRQAVARAEKAEAVAKDVVRLLEWARNCLPPVVPVADGLPGAIVHKWEAWKEIDAALTRIKEIVMGDDRTIRVWAFDDAPPEYQALSQNGGDEDWVVLVPNAFLAAHYPPLWVDRLDTCNEPEEHRLLNGDIVYIGCHA